MLAKGVLKFIGMATKLTEMKIVIIPNRLQSYNYFGGNLSLGVPEYENIWTC